MRRRAKVDGNHAEIVAAFRKAGWKVLSLAELGNGVPDLLVMRWEEHNGNPFMTRWFLVEVKQPKGKLTKDQERFRAEWPVQVVRTVDDALSL